MTTAPEIVVPLDSSFLPTTEDKAVGFKIIPSRGIPYFVESLPTKKAEDSEFSVRARKKKRIYKRKKTEDKADTA